MRKRILFTKGRCSQSQSIFSFLNKQTADNEDNKDPEKKRKIINKEI